ncbi:hypothetical protein CDD80_5298 [Ophiocordyceps camponoti-rufipedis]|uniref:Uncharacterized protein n=1 Tax=Ophiocordyceps camponoti-rufipedis TaxID=2004952 RepID=A0A2C5YUV3_9HYPO|nr:hypothetical protein CDD80_5298 [Ophiocordyceps camponoti-rufipedis]
MASTNVSLPRGHRRRSRVIADDEIIYPGSDDEDYPDSATRQLRYEAAAQRFLKGNVPFLLSASLRGPFDQARKQSTSKVPASVQDSMIDTQQCHLPSPESLRQVPASEPHVYLDGEGLVMVELWRHDVQPPSVRNDSFWSSNNAQQGSSVKKRRAMESAWLKREANKKRKSDSTGRGKSASASRDADSSCSDSSSLSSDFAASSPCGPQQVNGSQAEDSSSIPEQDEEMTGVMSVVLHNNSDRCTPKKDIALSGSRKNTSSNLRRRCSPADESDDGSLSSPVSWLSQASIHVPMVQEPEKGPTALTTAEDGSPSTDDEESSGTTTSDEDEPPAASMQRSCSLQKQHDRSLCFKVRLSSEHVEEITDAKKQPCPQSSPLSQRKAANHREPTATELPNDVETLEQPMPGNVGDGSDGEEDPFDSETASSTSSTSSTDNHKQTRRQTLHTTATNEDSETTSDSANDDDDDQVSGVQQGDYGASSAASVKVNMIPPTECERSTPLVDKTSQEAQSLSRCDHHDDEAARKQKASIQAVTPSPPAAQQHIIANQESDADSASNKSTSAVKEALYSDLPPALLPNQQSDAPTRQTRTSPTCPKGQSAGENVKSDDDKSPGRGPRPDPETPSESNDELGLGRWCRGRRGRR